MQLTNWVIELAGTAEEAAEEGKIEKQYTVWQRFYSEVHSRGR